jgi:hypothetical protein
VGEEQYSVLLEVMQSLETPEQLQLSLLVAINLPASDETAALQARLQWGSYKDTLTLDQYGRGRFVPVPLPAILDEAGKKIITDLELELMSDVSGNPQ